MERRWNEHVSSAKRNAKGGRWRFPNAILKYGKEAFSHEVLEVCHDLEVANLAEGFWIELFDSRNPEKGFNLAQGGERIPHPQRNPWDRPEYREKCTAASRARASNPLWRAKVSASHAGVPLSPEHRDSIRNSRVGRDHSPEVRARINGSVREVYSRPEIRSKHSAPSLRNWSDPVYVEKIRIAESAAIKTKWRDPNYRAKFLAHDGTHKVCLHHGRIPLAECYARSRRNHVTYECRECYRQRNRDAHARRKLIK